MKLLLLIFLSVVVKAHASLFDETDFTTSNEISTENALSPPEEKVNGTIECSDCHERFLKFGSCKGVKC